MLQDPKLMAAVSKIIQRSERQEDVQKLMGTYVDIGLLPQLNNENHQIFYGRRGTGKTHVMKVLESKLREGMNNTVVYIDCRTLGSTSQFSNTDLPMSRRCLSLFRDILLNIHHELFEHIVECPSKNANTARDEVEGLASLITEPLEKLKAEHVSVEAQASFTNEYGAGAKLKGMVPTMDFNGKHSEANAESTKKEYSVDYEDKIVFPELHRVLSSVLKSAETRLYVLIDEWSSIPQDIQPYLAEFLKKGVLPITAATLKISALEYRCRFVEVKSGNLVGFELGADIATAPDLDDYFVYDRNPEQITDIYSEVLLKHLLAELPENYLSDKFSISTPNQLASRLFTERKICSELARASEGVMRDLINIFTKAFFNAQRRNRTSIDKQAVIESAQQWFEQDKAQYLDDLLQSVLRRIVDEVIGKRQARSFMLPRHLEKNEVIQKMFDARVLHHMQRGYADKDNPGVRYNIYAIDYGTYVDLLGTSRQPELDLEEDRAGLDFIVPFDDKRSIRRIVMDENILSESMG
ncbi:ORC-CDC6 family AAA ATPase [Thiomicrorhabdus heinhorstiae]|uniref:ATP-binding protein n=1 Tax=Thiomicrorhabdus heinhorstiae TaxID=2748010 RepID=A0ABS0C2G1_9GAMM|nr:hypothetical protein [Thiomicrorhabdus heinhorstiae]MBF6058472.1 hypothetical protein [Thiomicrorhabdus heinhorstiae]